MAKQMRWVKTETDHLEMMRHPERWRFLILPLKHRSRTEPNGMRVVGFICMNEQMTQGEPKVYVGCIFFHSMGQKLEDLPVEEYPSLEAVVRAGWEVD